MLLLQLLQLNLVSVFKSVGRAFMGIRKQQRKLRRSRFPIGGYPLQGAVKGMVRWLLRVLLKVDQRPRWTSAGFVLPTTIMLLLIVTLTVGSISLRTLSRTTQTIGDRQQRVIYNAATPAIDRAKAKLEFLFDPGQDDRLPTGVPSEQLLLDMMLNRPPVDPNNIQPDELRQVLLPAPADPNGVDPYTFPDERATATALGVPAGLDGRLDVNNDGQPDNAWVYSADTDGNGNIDALVAYSIFFETPDNINDLANASDGAVAARADALQVRNAPLSSIVPSDPVCQDRADAPPVEAGWFTDLAASRKNFQVDAVIIPLSENAAVNGQFVENPNGTLATLEFQQDRQYDEGNKWGAWFRNDLEIFSAPDFNWNGAMHTEGNFIVGRNRKFKAFLISSPNSCLYDRQSSEITIAEIPPNNTRGLPAFQGQVIAGQLFEVENSEPRAIFHVHDDPTPITNPGTDPDAVLLEAGNDSLVNNGMLAELSLDPVRLFTEDVSVPRSATPVDFGLVRDNNWELRDLAKTDTGRVYNTGTQSAPRIDDFFRADNRLGPKPRYDGILISQYDETPANGIDPTIGDETTEPDLIRLDAPDSNVGLDGYWERRARVDGMRVIVGQRLELGNAFGWRGATFVDTIADPDDVADDPLYPWNDTTCTDRCHEAKQRRTLRDNLAAVQSMAIYHAAGGSNDGDFPRLCMAMTAHPGTPVTIDASTTFNPLPGIAPVGVPNLDISFFDGHGTNGWEYSPPAASSAAFANAITNAQPMGIALRNLAHFAGDPLGGAPSFPPAQLPATDAAAVVHPFPNLAMWGDFSILRRIFDDELDAGATYVSLSPADKTYLHTAACTVGMLASNIDALSRYDYTANLVDLTALNTEIANAVVTLTDGNRDNGELALQGTVWRFDYPGSNAFTTIDAVPGVASDTGAIISGFPPEAVISLLPDPQKRLAEIIHLREQVVRDRRAGFDGGLLCADLTAFSTTNALPQLANLCPIQPKFPALYYLFPLADHLHDGNLPGGLPPAVDTGAVQPTDEPYVTDSPYVFDTANPLIGVNAGYVYQVVDTADVDPLVPANSKLIAGAVLAPRGSTADWIAPTGVSNADTPNVINVGGADVAISFLDKGVYNGRDSLSTRVLDMDLALLRANVIGTDNWLPKLSIIYSFREDAVREDMVVRPASSAPGSCSNDADIQAALCLMNGIGEFQNPGGVAANPLAQDPPLNADNLISPKAVDYYADPDRRPNGFRLRNGSSIKRNGDNGRGLSFISDNPLYVQGDFNLHQNAECGTEACRIEEFTQKLPDDGDFTVAEFYTNRTDLEPDFARQDSDFWRPAEILSDSVTLISDNFCDGSAADVFLTSGEGQNAEITTAITQHDSYAGYAIGAYRCNGADNRTSYLNQNLPTENTNSDEIWMRENPFDFDSPIEISRNGAPRFIDDLANPYPNTEYRSFANQRPLSDAVPTRVDAVIFSGIVPSRPNQSYGGLHNFPRLLERWGIPNGDNTTLAIAGAFIQLDFSNYATAAYDQEAWEPEANPTLLSNENRRYYFPPLRAWGYDVGLQYAPSAPITRRFANPGSFRSEFYNEPEANDAYIQKLRDSLDGFLAVVP